MQENTQPPMGSRERVVLLSGNLLPDDATETNLNTDSCIVWKSAKLKELIGVAYAAGTTTPGATSAEMRAETTPVC
jgi:hypothetical protein